MLLVLPSVATAPPAIAMEAARTALSGLGQNVDNLLKARIGKLDDESPPTEMQGEWKRAKVRRQPSFQMLAQVQTKFVPLL